MKLKIQVLVYVFLAFLFVLPGTVIGQKKYSYQSFPNDPYNARIYTLDNGLKVYLSPYAEEPRIQAFVSVQVGSKDDPAETTGLAHYFEHLMFKGTKSYGTSNWEKEKPLLDQIQALFENYRKQTDPEARKAIYKQIDSLSYLASTFAIPNEYDRLMKAIGSTGTNAFTSNDYTSYVENIPSNQVRNWAKIQAERFRDPVLRLFHTELETVYEEKNMSLTNDGRQASEALYAGLFPEHPYGTQTTLGEAEHLKNPSLINIRNFYEKYYVPNNMAVVMSGDFNPDEVIAIIDEYFGKLKPGVKPTVNAPKQFEVKGPVVKEVVGLQAESISIGWRFNGLNSPEMPVLNMIRMILSNGKSGLIDQNLNKPLKILAGGAGVRGMVDHSVFTLSGRNQKNQSLDEVKALLIEQMELLKKGEFPDWLMVAALNNLRLNEMRNAENLRSRASILNSAFMNRQPYTDVINYIDILGKVTREDIINFANKHFGDDNYVVVYKKQGKPDVAQVEKPSITPIFINRDDESPFVKQIKADQPPLIEPVFVDYNKDFTKAKTKNGIEIFYVENKTNPTFSLNYEWEKGSHHDKILPFAAGFVNFLGTEKYSPEDIANEFYKMACNFSVSVSSEETSIGLSGLSENMESAMKLFEELVWKAKADEAGLKRYIETVKKSRSDSKANQQTVFGALVSYATYGENNPDKYTLTDQEIDALTPEQMIKAIQRLWSEMHQVVFYGPQTVKELSGLLKKHHKTAKKLTKIERIKLFKPLETKENKVYFAHYDANQSYLQTIAKGKEYDITMSPLVSMYNMYFGGGMNAIVFQEMREKRGLAYTARSSYSSPGWPDENYMNTSFIATQNDKVIDAFTAFNELFNQMPMSESSFNLAKEQIISNIRTQRIRNISVVWNYMSAIKMGHVVDPRIQMFKAIPNLTLADVSKFNSKFIKDQKKTYVILGNENLIDFKKLESMFGPVKKISREELFSY
jgi:predicted Zn-dependent peptidase